MPDTVAASLLSGFIGVLVGGIITYLATLGIEVQKSKQLKKDRRADDLRAALRRAAEWIAPIEFAVARAHAASGQAEEAWVRFVSELASVQGNLAETFLLPPELQNVNNLIVQQLANLQFYEISEPHGLGSREELLKVLMSLRKLTTEFRGLVREAYNATFE